MMQKIYHKKGDTFSKPCQRQNKTTGLAVDLTGVTIKSQVRTRPDKGDTLVAELTVNVVNPTAGSFILSAADTSAWPAETLVWDIQYTVGSAIISTDSLYVQVYPDGTR